MRALVLLALGACTGRDPVTCAARGHTYEAGAYFASDCNSCLCMEDGQWACTAIGCLEMASPIRACGAAGTDVQCGTAARCGDTCCADGETCNGYQCVCGDSELICNESVCRSSTGGACGDFCD